YEHSDACGRSRLGLATHDRHGDGIEGRTQGRRLLGVGATCREYVVELAQQTTTGEPTYATPELTERGHRAVVAEHGNAHRLLRMGCGRTRDACEHGLAC